MCGLVIEAFLRTDLYYIHSEQAHFKKSLRVSRLGSSNWFSVTKDNERFVLSTRQPLLTRSLASILR